MDSIYGDDYAYQAMSEKYTGIPYSKLDCQAFVEEVLKDCGVRKPDGSVYNWRGSNSMWRTALAWKGTVDECITKYGKIPQGAWVFIVKRDGGEKARGYNDDQGNATHVGIYCNPVGDPVRDSTRTAKRDGVGYRPLTGFTHVGLPKMIIYNEETPSSDDEAVLTALDIIRDNTRSAEEVLKALKILTKYLKEVSI